MEKKTFGKRIVTPKHVAIAVSIVILFGLFYLNQIQLIAYILILIFIIPVFYPYKIDKGYLTQGNFVAILITLNLIKTRSTPTRSIRSIPKDLWLLYNK